MRTSNHVTPRISGGEVLSGYALSKDNFQLRSTNVQVKRAPGRPRKEFSERIQIEKNRNLNNGNSNNNYSSTNDRNSNFQSKLIDKKYSREENKYNSRSRSTGKLDDAHEVIQINTDDDNYNNNKNQSNRANDQNNVQSFSNSYAGNIYDKSPVNNNSMKNLNEYLTPSQHRVFSYFATINPQNLIKDEKFNTLKTIISTKYNDDRVRNFLCMYLLYSEKELMSTNINNNQAATTNNNVKNNSKKYSIKICKNQISEQFSNLYVKIFQGKNLRVCPKVNELNILIKEDSIKNSSTTEAKSNGKISECERKTIESENSLQDKAEAGLPLNIFNNFSQNGANDIQTSYKYPQLNLQLPSLPFNANQAPFLYNPMYYCLPQMIPNTQLLNYPNDILQRKYSNGTTIYKNTMDKPQYKETSINNLEIGEVKNDLFTVIEDKPQEKTNNKKLLKRKRIRNIKHKVDKENNSKTGQTTPINSQNEINKNTNNFEIHLDNTDDRPIKNKSKFVTTAPDIFDKVSKQMDIIHRTPSFQEEGNFLNENSFRFDNLIDLNNDSLFGSKDKDDLDLESPTENTLNNRVLNFNNNVDKGFKEKFPNTINISLNSSGNDDDHLNKKENSSKTNNNKVNPNKSKASAVKSSASTAVSSTLKADVSPTDKSQIIASNLGSKTEMSKNLLPSIVESKSKKDEINSNSTVDVSERKNQIFKILKNLTDRAAFDKLRNLLPEKTFKLLEDCFYIQSKETINKSEVTILLIENYFMKFIPETGKFSVFRK